MRTSGLALIAVLAGCEGAPTDGAPADAAPAAVVLAVDPEASFLEDTARFRIVLKGEGFMLQAWLPLDLVRDHKAPDGTVDLEVAPEKCLFYPGPRLPDLQPSAGPPRPVPTGPPARCEEVDDATIGFRHRRARRGGGGSSRIEIRCSAFTAGGRRYAAVPPVRLEVRGPKP